MPNWCENRMSITGGNVDEISKIIEKDGGIFKSESFLATPEELINKSLSSEELIEKFGFDDWYVWNVENLGTKWDFETEDNVDLSDGFFCFRTAWSPPEAFCRFISEKFSCLVTLEFVEPGVCFSGRTVYGNGLCIEEYCEDTIFTEIGLELLCEDCSWYIENEDEEFLLNLSDDAKNAIMNSVETCDEVLELLRNDKKTKEKK